MGLLDDAIREHLDLKRRRGADPDEVAREENEALGPPRIGQFVAPGDDLEPADPPEPEFVDAGGEPAGEPAAERAPEPSDEQERPAAVAAGSVEDAPAATRLDDEEPWLEDPLEPPPERPEPLDEATAEFTAPALEPAESQGEGAARDDVLEETPDFLQETPEHDRLWFEQRPPRDFDFDK